MALPTVTRSLNRISLSGRLNTEAIPLLIEAVRGAETAGFEEFTLDFSHCVGAFSSGTVPLAALADMWRRNSFEFQLVLPRDLPLARLFENTGLAHVIDPDTYPAVGSATTRNIPIRRYQDLKEQVALVNSFMDILLRTTLLTRDVLQGLEWSLNEVVDNVLNHANSPGGGFASLTTGLTDKVQFTVADCGVGVLASLREAYPQLRYDTDSLGEAIKAGVTRNRQAGQGNGLAGTLRIATASGGSFSIMSGVGRLNVFHDPKTKQLASRKIVSSQSQRFPGTVVDAQIMKNPSFRVADALGFTGMIGGIYNLIEAHYESETGNEFMMKLANETTGFGSRESGRQVRTKCLNLLDADKARPLVLDWSGVPVISSSFADEAIGKLFVELGPLSFSSRVRNIGVEPLVRGLIEKAILQRASEASQRFTTGNQALDTMPTTTEGEPQEPLGGSSSSSRS